MPPTTLTFTSECLLSYSATIFLNSLSSRALQPTQIVIVVALAEDVPALACVLAVAATAAAPSTSATSNPIPTRFIPSLPWGDCDQPRSAAPAPVPTPSG